MTEPIELAAIVTTNDGRVLGFTDDESCRAWMKEHEVEFVATADWFHRNRRSPIKTMRGQLRHS